MTHLLNFLILLILLIGRSLHTKNRQWHIRLVSAAMAADVLLVIFLAVARRVLGKISTHFRPELGIHLAFAITTFIAYGFAVKFGRQLLAGDERARPPMRRVDRFVLVSRIGTFVTSLFL